ncbi:MAG TPA: protein kinase, partial [Candidatus Eisenbacteria bacterium]
MKKGEADDDRDLIRLVEAVCDGDSVDWEAESAERPHLGPMIGPLRLVESLMSGHAWKRRPARPSVRAPEADGPEGRTAGDAPPDPTRRWGHLDLLEKIEQGGFGEVYRAFDPTLQREVALKLPRPGRIQGAAAADQFIREARRLARVGHPNVLVVHGAGWHGGRAGIWTDLVRGQTLEAIVAQQGPLGAREAAGIGIDLCRALSAVHAAGLFHHDVKTCNVMREHGGRIVLMDFGAVGEAIELDPDCHRVGTLTTMAPERLRGEAGGATADIYSLGVLLYRLVTGRFPIQAARPAGLEVAQARGEPVPLGDLRPDLPGDFVRVVERALDPDPARRYPSAGAMEKALLELAADSPKPGGANRGGAHAGRMWLGASILVLVAVLGSGLVVPERRPTASQTAPPAAGSSVRVPRMGASGPAPAVENAAGQAATSAEAPDAPEATATLMLERERRAVPLASGDHITPGDGLFLEFRAGEPLDVYVLDEDATGSVFVLFPAPGLDMANPLSAGNAHRLPGMHDGRFVDWQVTSAGGDEAITVIAARRPLPALEREIASFPPARPGEPINYGQLDDRALGAPRGVGGLASPQSIASARRLTRLTPLLHQILSDPETKGGTWVWRIDL